MTRRFSRRSLLRTAGTLSGAGMLGSRAAAAEGPGSYIVGTRDRSGQREARSRADVVHRELDFGDIGQAVVGRFSQRALDALRNRADVRYVEPDGEVQALGQTLPWGVDRVDADVVHEAGETGAGADIAIIDTGIDSDHPDLRANVGEGFAVEVCSGSNCTYDWDDDNDHGTHCAGIADAVNNADGVVGVSTEATLHSVKVLDDSGSGTYSGVAEGVQWVADKGYDVGSMSLGGGSSSRTLRDACQYASDAGVLLVAAAGNDGPCTDCVRYPAAYDTVIAVSASHDSDELAGYSSTGPEVELLAPGSQVTSTVVGGYDTYSGTSMACPHVSGAAAHLMAGGDTSSEARGKLGSTAEDLGLAENEQGSGLLDVAAALGHDSSSVVDVRTGDPTDVGDTSVTLNGELVDLGDSSTADVGFKYHDIDADTWHLTGTQTMSSTGSYSATLSELSEDTAYEFQAKAWEEDGDTDEGVWASFTTGSADTSVAVSTESATSVGETSATLAGELTSLGGASSADCYLEYRERETSSWTATSPQVLSDTGSFSDDVSGLSSGIDYEFRAVAEASDGDVDTGTTLTFTTDSAETSVVVGTDEATSVGSTTATLNGTLDDLGGADSADVHFQWGERGGSLPHATSAQTRSSAGAFEADITGLSAGSDYEFRAVAEASDGDSDEGSTLGFSTSDESAEPAVDRYRVSEAGSPNPHADITADWTVSDDDGDLDAVLVEVFDTSGRRVDASRSSVGGGSDSGTDEFKIKHAGRETFDVRLTVTDASGDSTSQTETVSS